MTLSTNVLLSTGDEKQEFNTDPYVKRPWQFQRTLFQSQEVLNVGCSSSCIIHVLLYICVKIDFYYLIVDLDFFHMKKAKVIILISHLPNSKFVSIQCVRIEDPLWIQKKKKKKSLIALNVGGNINFQFLGKKK